MPHNPSTNKSIELHTSAQNLEFYDHNCHHVTSRNAVMTKQGTNSPLLFVTNMLIGFSEEGVE